MFAQTLEKGISMVKNLMLVSALLVSLVAGLGLGYGLANPTQYEHRIADLETEATELNNQISTLEVEKSGLELQVSELQQWIEAKDNQISSLYTQVTRLMGEISELERQLEVKILGIYFSPKGGCENQVLYWLDRANASIHILIYSFTLDSVGDALVEAHNRGVEVQVVFETEQVTRYSEYQGLRAAGVPVRNDTNSDLMHNKVMIVDGLIVLTGSFNWSTSGEESNNENLIVINSTYIAGIYEEEFREIWNESI